MKTATVKAEMRMKRIQHRMPGLSVKDSFLINGGDKYVITEIAKTTVVLNDFYIISKDCLRKYFDYTI